MYIYVCITVYYLYIYILYTCIHKYKYVSIYSYNYIYTYAGVCMNAYVYSYVRVYVSAYIYTCIHEQNSHVYKYICVLCMCTYVIHLLLWAPGVCVWPTQGRWHCWRIWQSVVVWLHFPRQRGSKLRTNILIRLHFLSACGVGFVRAIYRRTRFQLNTRCLHSILGITCYSNILHMISNTQYVGLGIFVYAIDPYHC